MRYYFGFRVGKSLVRRAVLDDERLIRLDLPKIRPLVKICLIDDLPYLKQDELNSRGYNITHFHDVSNISQISDYSIILCDLNNVGRKLDSDLQGASIISLVREASPTKYIIAYTGNDGRSPMMLHARKHADNFLFRDSDAEAWAKELDHAIISLRHPRRLWNRIRSNLEKANFSENSIDKVRENFIRFAEQNISKEAFISNIEKLDQGRPELSGIALNIISSFIYDFMKN